MSNVLSVLRKMRYTASGGIVGAALVGCFAHGSTLMVGNLGIKDVGAIVGAVLTLFAAIKWDLQ